MLRLLGNEALVLDVFFDWQFVLSLTIKTRNKIVNILKTVIKRPILGDHVINRCNQLMQLQTHSFIKRKKEENMV